jgi:hypothetical protein
MNYVEPTTFIDFLKYDIIVSLGNKCPTASIMRKIGVYKDSFPFDYIPTTPKLILKYLKDQKSFYPEKNKTRTSDSVWFGHFNLNEKYDETIQTFKRRFERLFKFLKDKKKVLFVYSSEADIYNEMGNRYNDNYSDICMIKKYIIEKYNYTNFTIAAIHTNKTFKDDEIILNFRINVSSEYLSSNMETHNEKTTSEYRNQLELLLLKIFSLSK